MTKIHQRFQEYSWPAKIGIVGTVVGILSAASVPIVWAFNHDRGFSRGIEKAQADVEMVQKQVGELAERDRDKETRPRNLETSIPSIQTNVEWLRKIKEQELQKVSK